MAIRSDSPGISVLRRMVEETAGKKPQVHTDFVALSDAIGQRLREHISETTLERLWNYSTRGYATVSRRTLDVLARFCRFDGWDDFCGWLARSESTESDFFDVPSLLPAQLAVGDSVRFGWLPDRLCVARYLGDDLFEATECENGTLQPADRFRCQAFHKGRPAIITIVSSPTNIRHDGKTYVAGTVNGLTTLEHLPQK